jgi:predicted GIY-YIG superfamily endonuclease
MSRRISHAYCLEKGLLCKTRNEFKQRFTNAYRAALRSGWLDVFSHMPEHAERPWYRWPDLEAARAGAARFTSFVEFQRKESGLFTLAKQRGWFEEITAHISPAGPTGPRIWTKSACASVAKPHTSRSAFRMAEPSAYTMARKNGWLTEICAHIPRQGGNALRAVYVMREKGTRRVYVGISHKTSERYKAHLRKPAKSMRDFLSRPHLFRVVTPLLDKEVAANAERYLIRRFADLGWTIMNAKVGGDLGGNKRKWTPEKLQGIADIVESRNAMLKQYPGAYAMASHHGLLNKLFENHPNQGFITIEDRRRRRRRRSTDHLATIAPFELKDPETGNEISLSIFARYSRLVVNNKAYHFTIKTGKLLAVESVD